MTLTLTPAYLPPMTPYDPLLLHTAVLKVFAQWDGDEAAALLEHFVKFRKEKLGAFQAFFKESSALLELYGSKRVPGELPLPVSPPY